MYMYMYNVCACTVHVHVHVQMNAVCPLSFALYMHSHLQLYYLSSTKEANQATLEWVVDFSGCGLVIHQLAVKARCYYDNPENVTFTVRGDGTQKVSPQMGGRHSVGFVGLLGVCLQTEASLGTCVCIRARVECMRGCGWGSCIWSCLVWRLLPPYAPC